MNFYPFNIGDYAGKTRHLTWDEDMAYRRLLDVYYSNEQPLPADKRQVYRLAGAQTTKQKQAVDTVLKEFFEATATGFSNTRCDEEIAKATLKKEKARESARLSVEARSAKSIRGERMEVARQKGTHTKSEWLALVEVCGNHCVRCGATGHLDKDHIKPVYQGGGDGIDNLQPLCARCNASKGPESTDHRPADWQQRLEDKLSERSAFGERSLSERLAPNPNPNPNPNDREEMRSARDPDASLEAILRNAAGWASDPSPKLAIIGEIQALLDNGADLELDVLPVIRANAAKCRRPNWRFFVEEIAEQRDRRVAAGTLKTTPIPAAGSHNGSHRAPPARDTFAALEQSLAEQRARAERRAREAGEAERGAGGGEGDRDQVPRIRQGSA